MRKRGKYTKKPSSGKIILWCAIVLALVAGIVLGAMYLLPKLRGGDAASAGTTASTAATSETTAPLPTETEPPETTEPAPKWEVGYIGGLEAEVPYYDLQGNLVGTLTRGTRVEYGPNSDGRICFLLDCMTAYLTSDTYVAAEETAVIPEHTLYVRTAVNLRDAQGRLLEAFAQKGDAVTVTGYDYLETGKPHMYQVKLGDAEGYVMPWYLVSEQAASLENYDEGDYETHAGRSNRYGGGDGASLDYFPREKGAITGNTMPEECRTLYLVNWRLGDLGTYLDIAKNSGINAFVVDIMDGSAVGYAGEVMKANSPSSAAAACNSVEDYQAAIKRIKDAGYYVIGRITTFNDSLFIKDHPEYAITDKAGNPLKLSGEYWPTAYNRAAWQYKVDLAVEAVELMGFNEIQFDYVRFPDRTSSYEEAGTIDFHNAFGETKAQAIQRFLMYATDILHEKGVYVSADVYGESAYTYVTGYGQYWPAISNVVDVISGMPYPDHFSKNGDYRPWEHPYETLKNWGDSVMIRQSETATPAAVRTWIQAYNAIREPYNTYGPEEVAAQIKGLRDAGCTGGYMTWHSSASTDKYRSLIPAFAPPEN